MVGPDLARLLGSLTEIANCMLLSLFAEEEVALRGGVTLKLNPKPKVDKVSPVMWITANSRIMVQMIDESKTNFDVMAYLQSTEIKGELVACYTEKPVLFFDVLF